MRATLIEIKQDMPGFDHFFGSWVCQDDLAIVVDVGPANTAVRLIESLNYMGVERVDYVFLTHLHIDHCGGLAELLDHYPMARVICHENGIDYLTDPSKLWKGSLAVLGEIAEVYGPPKPVARDRLIPHTENDLKDLMVIETPGHAAHHLSFSYRNQLFVGEAGGNYLVIEDMEYLRPATPPRFFFDVCVKSVDKLLAIEDQPICYAHFDGAESSHRLLRTFRDQLMRWNRIIRESTAGRLNGDDDLVRRCIDTLLEQDPDLRAFERMDPDTQKRERFFMANAVKGFIGFFRENKTDEIIR
ncbi:MAG: MBL fold metallo-hydrolase [Proteobacteria bacterium]|nr:MBL fold metallo-hydrolase [Pseudomonadota bacterium]